MQILRMTEPLKEGMRVSTRSENREALEGLFYSLRVDFGQSSGEAIIKTILAHLGGLRVSIPDLEDFCREDRDRRICALFNGNNHDELSARFCLSRMQIRRIIENERSDRHTGRDGGGR
jgi:hypothetical protein